MPRGIPNHRVAEHVIALDESPLRGGLRGRIDRLQKEFLMKAQALKITIDILDADDRQTALDVAPKKFIQAMNLRNTMNGHAAAEPAPEPKASKKPAKRPRLASKDPRERQAEIVAFLTSHSNATTNEIAEALGYTKAMVLRYAHDVAKPADKDFGPMKPIRWVLRKGAAKKAKANGRAPKAEKKTRGGGSKIKGKPLSLFLLEQLRPDAGLTQVDLVQRLADAGAPVKSAQNLNAPMGAVLAGNGYARRDGKLFFLTAKGAEYATELRQKLESAGKVTQGGYTA